MFFFLPNCCNSDSPLPDYWYPTLHLIVEVILPHCGPQTSVHFPAYPMKGAISPIELPRRLDCSLKPLRLQTFSLPLAEVMGASCRWNKRGWLTNIDLRLLNDKNNWIFQPTDEIHPPGSGQYLRDSDRLHQPSRRGGDFHLHPVPIACFSGELVWGKKGRRIDCPGEHDILVCGGYVCRTELFSSHDLLLEFGRHVRLFFHRKLCLVRI